MQIFVRSLDKTLTVELSENATVRDLKAAIEDVEFIPQGESLPLLFFGLQLPG